MNMSSELNIKYSILSRVRTVHMIRAILMSPFASVLFGIALAGYLCAIVSLGDVVSNTMSHVDWSQRFSYALSSLLHSRIIVQMIASLFVLTSLFAFFNILRRIPVRKISSSVRVLLPFSSI